MNANDASALVEGCVPGELPSAEEWLPPRMAAHRDLILTRLNARLRQDLGTDKYELVLAEPSELK
jgi:hypothetical protein